MKFLLDESAEYRLARFLKGLGHDVTAIAHEYPHALADREVLRLAHHEGRILITNDRDFGGLVVRERLAHAGVIYFRIPAGDIDLKIQRLTDLLRNHASDLSRLVVVEERDFRFR